MALIAAVLYLGYSLALSVISCCYVLVAQDPALLVYLIPAFFFILFFAGTLTHGSTRFRLAVCNHGAALLLAFEIAAALGIVYHIVLAFFTIPDDYKTLLWSLLVFFLTESVVFWSGVSCIYLTSVQMGITNRFLGAFSGLIPYVNVVAMNFIIWTVLTEVRVEAKKDKVNRARKKYKICQTKYPVVMVHGVFFRDIKYFNYWGRIPRELETNGATVYYGHHQSADAIADSAQELAQRIRELVETTGCEKVNIIAHSKGGLDCRYAIAKLGMGEYVASLTTINTPHKGCIYVDRLLEKTSEKLHNYVAKRYNRAYRILGDHDPDFLAAVRDLSASACEKFNQEITYIPDDIFCQSVGSVIQRFYAAKFPIILAYPWVKRYDGIGDGLVGADSFPWGERYTLLTPKRKKSISHCDMTDLYRRNQKHFDVREFYVQLVSDLRERGL